MSESLTEKKERDHHYRCVSEDILKIREAERQRDRVLGTVVIAVMFPLGADKKDASEES